MHILQSSLSQMGSNLQYFHVTYIQTFVLVSALKPYHTWKDLKITNGVLNLHNNTMCHVQSKGHSGHWHRIHEPACIFYLEK